MTMIMIKMPAYLGSKKVISFFYSNNFTNRSGKDRKK